MVEDLARALEEIGPRAPGSDAERRAGRVLARSLRSAGLRPRTEALWVRPRRAAALAVACGLGVAGSVVSADHPETGLALAAVATLLAFGELVGVPALLRLLTRERATQNVVLTIPARREPARDVLLTAALDSRRGGVMTRWGIPFPGVVAVTTLAIVSAFAAARVADVDNAALGPVQLVPTVALILLVGGLLDEAFAAPGPSRRSAAVAAAAAASLAKIPPRHATVHLVLAGASPDGLRAWRRRHREVRDPFVLDVDRLEQPTTDLVLGLIARVESSRT